MPGIYPLTGTLQNYSWGGNEFIPALLGIPGTDQPIAEYWLGAHQNSPAKITQTEGDVPLDKFLKSNPAYHLGREIYERFGRLPYLFKVLDVKEMLSIQVHPTKSEAEKGFEKENRMGISLSAPNRNYKDDNHKPEIMVALSDFWLLHGFLPARSLTERLLAVPELSNLIELFESGGYQAIYKKVMEESAEETNECLRPLLERVLPLFREGKLNKSEPDYWAAKSLNDVLPAGNIDKGIYSIYFFNIVGLKKGEAIFQDAGIPHAYLEGQNMELMANSDNVLRAGLTPKHVDVKELLKHVVFKATHPEILHGIPKGEGFERVYECPVPDFELSKIELPEGKTYRTVSKTAEIIMAMKGRATIICPEEIILLEKGSSVLVSANSDYQIKAEYDVEFYKATAPVRAH